MRRHCILCYLILLLSMLQWVASGTIFSEHGVQTTALFTSGSTLYVGGTGPNNYTTIQRAIDNASESDTVFVYAGTYHESLVVPSSLRLSGENTDNTIIYGTIDEYTILLKGTNTRLTGFTIKGEGGAAGIQITGGYNIVTHCDIRGMAYGIYFFQSSFNIVTNCSFINTRWYGVIMVNCPNCGHYSQQNTLHHNNFIVQNTDAFSSVLNFWDNGHEGNYWSYYTGEDEDGDGIGETPYSVTGGGGQDKYPLMNPIDHTAPNVTLVYPNGGEMLSGNVTVTWHVSDNCDVQVACDLQYSGDNGASWHTVIAGLVDKSEYIWDTEQLKTGERYLLRITALDDAGNRGQDRTDSTFTIIHPPSVSITTPAEGHLYLMGRAVLPLPARTVIVGKINVEADATSDIGVDTVKVYIDSGLKAEITNDPYTWLWDETIAGRHMLKAVVYDTLGNTKHDRREVWIFNV